MLPASLCRPCRGSRATLHCAVPRLAPWATLLGHYRGSGPARHAYLSGYAVMPSWDHLAVMPPRPAVHSRNYPSRDKKPGEGPGFRWTRSPFSEEEERKSSLKMKDRRGNVYENKGPTFRSPLRSGNVVENKDSYALKPGMLLKIHMLAVGLEFSSRRSVAVQFGFLVARSTCLGLPWMTKVPRRGTTSLAVGETHGQGPSDKIAHRPRRGRTPSIPTRRQTKFNPFGVGKSSGRIVSVGFTHGY